MACDDSVAQSLFDCEIVEMTRVPSGSSRPRVQTRALRCNELPPARWPPAACLLPPHPGAAVHAGCKLGGRACSAARPTTFSSDRTERHTLFLVPGAGRLSRAADKAAGLRSLAVFVGWRGECGGATLRPGETWGDFGSLPAVGFRRGVVPTLGPVPTRGWGDRCDGVFACDSRVARSLKCSATRASRMAAWTAA